MQASFEIRLAAPQDMPALLPLFRNYQDHYGQLTVAGEAQTQAFLADHLRHGDHGFVLLAWSGRIAVGFASVYLTASGLLAERLAHLGDLYVVPEQRRRGVGRALFDAVSAEARQRGIRLVRWLSLGSNVELNRWYNRLVNSAGNFELFLRPTDGGTPPGAH
ncbi:MAG TPA: GNAT family N-acetyltransferase [Opitutaceae bacterium]